MVKNADKLTSTESKINSDTAPQTNKKSIKVPKEKFISPGKNEQIIDELGLIQYNIGTLKNYC